MTHTADANPAAPAVPERGLKHYPVPLFAIVMGMAGLTLEMGLISPPVGVNVFIVKSLVPHVTLGTIFRGVVPFWIAMIVTLGLLVAFPSIALYLPDTMIN